MHQERENLDILFRRTAPEVVLDNIRCYGQIFKDCRLKADVLNYSQTAYEHYASLNLPEYSPDEVELRYQFLKKCMTEGSDQLLFHALYKYADKVLVMKGSTPVCKLDAILGWNSISKRLGQDIFTMAWLARKDAEENVSYKRNFIWPAVLGTDDRRLEAVFEKGLAENHFHLHGSTQSFAISWTCFMNHPEYLEEYFTQKNSFSENLNFSISKGVTDNQMSWKTRLEYAIMIRALLFARCAGIMDSEKVWMEFKRFDRMPSILKMKRQTESLRRVYGVRFKQDEQDAGKKACLDYAISRYFYRVEEESANRLLTGERSFLYHCFRRVFEGLFTYQETSLLYLYLLIKSQFRSELIQANKRSGFTNFSWYQDRKNRFFRMRNEYWIEAQRLSIGAAVEEGHLISLEARIMPGDTVAQMKQEITGLNSKIQLALGKDRDMPYYVVHFPKKKFSKDEFKDYTYLLRPRNWPTRELAKRRAKALVKYLQTYDRKEECIWGIDACSLEIGCRPEVFATEFRYIRKYGERQEERFWSDIGKNRHEKLGITYHVGEDFLDIMDGLRAIDEAMIFLQMQKGDRMGHALALGIDPEEYYQMKKREIYIPMQDYLDNLIWMLYKSLEYNIQIDANHRAEMQELAMNLLSEIYGYDNSPFNKEEKKRQLTELLDMYYASWKLRGDHPDLYSTGSFRRLYSLADEEYMSCMAADSSLETYRGHKVISELYFLYHFDTKAKQKGLEPACFKVKDWYIDLVRKFQAAMRLEVAVKGIAIECNPTSNVLIGTFEFYDRHPILAFNDHHLDELSKGPNIQVSINTDDLGVFDTSLENEYALLLCAICRARHREGNYNDDAVYEYLDYIRDNGIRMAFRH